MKIEINVEKKHVYLLAALVLLLTATIVIAQTAANNVDKTKAWHKLQQVAKGVGSTVAEKDTSVDWRTINANGDGFQMDGSGNANVNPDGIVDRANIADYAMNAKGALIYVGSCMASPNLAIPIRNRPAATCTCGKGETIMLLEFNTAGGTGSCGVALQATTSVYGICDGASLGPSTFACFVQVG